MTSQLTNKVKSLSPINSTHSKEIVLVRVAPGNVKVSLKMSNLKPLHARWIVEIYDYLKQETGSILNGFDKAGITEAVKSANKVFARS